MQRLEVSGAVRIIYRSLGVKRLILQRILQNFKSYVEIIPFPTDKSDGQAQFKPCMQEVHGHYVQPRHRQSMRVSLQSLHTTARTALYSKDSTHPSKSLPVHHL